MLQCALNSRALLVSACTCVLLIAASSACLACAPCHAAPFPWGTSCRQETRKRKRLLKRAAKLTPDDLMQLCVMKGIAEQTAEAEDANMASGAAGSSTDRCAASDVADGEPRDGAAPPRVDA